MQVATARTELFTTVTYYIGTRFFFLVTTFFIIRWTHEACWSVKDPPTPQFILDVHKATLYVGLGENEKLG